MSTGISRTAMIDVKHYTQVLLSPDPISARNKQRDAASYMVQLCHAPCCTYERSQCMYELHCS
jgi:hypothetical protein